MIKDVTVNTQYINISYLQECLKNKFSHSVYTMTNNGDVILFSYKRSKNSHWTNFTIEVKQPVIFLYEESDIIVAYGTPDDQADFESDFANNCYEILNELE